MNKFLLLSFGFLVYTCIVISCTSVCENQTEPRTTFHNKENEDIAFDFSIYWFNENGDSISYDHLNTLRLPIDRDTVVFYFKQDLGLNFKLDTLGIRYQKNLIYQNRVCGYTVALDSFEILPITSFQKVSFSRNTSTPSQPDTFIKVFNPDDLYIIKIEDL